MKLTSRTRLVILLPPGAESRARHANTAVANILRPEKLECCAGESPSDENKAHCAPKQAECIGLSTALGQCGSVGSLSPFNNSIGVGGRRSVWNAGLPRVTGLASAFYLVSRQDRASTQVDSGDEIRSLQGLDDPNRISSRLSHSLLELGNTTHVLHLL